jgi:hypothetical protein
MAAIGTAQFSGGEYLLWYEGEPPGSSIRGDIGLATSADGLAWTKHDDPATTDAELAVSDPVITTGICGPDTALAVEQPQVEPGTNGLVALFLGTGGRGSTDIYGAVSDDAGRTWRCGSPTALLLGEDIPGSDGIHTIASVSLGAGRIGVIIESLSGEQSQLWWATVEVTGP